MTETAAAYEVELDGERVRVTPTGHLEVESKSNPGTWYDVTCGPCQCKAGQHGHGCRHLRVRDTVLAHLPCAKCGRTPSAKINRDGSGLCHSHLLVLDAG